MFSDDQLLPISALQHLIFCERQCALIHVERLWAENQFTVEGNHLHQRAHGDVNSTGKVYFENGIKIVRGLHLRSLQLGLVGQADVVEIADDRVTPVEYKRGKPKNNDCDRVQICAQAICLEEMFKTEIECGSLFYGKRKRRTQVDFTTELRNQTAQAIGRLREMIDNRETPAAVRQPKCDSCSLERICLPGTFRLKNGAQSYIERSLKLVLQDGGPVSDDSKE